MTVRQKGCGQNESKKDFEKERLWEKTGRNTVRKKHCERERLWERKTVRKFL